MLFDNDSPNVSVITSEMIVNEQITEPIITMNTESIRTSPAHYARLNPQTIQRLQDVLTPEEFQGFCRGNIIKYAERMRHKDDPVKEAKKICDYSNWLYQSLKGEKITL